MLQAPSNKVYEDDMMLAFRDINPQAPEHIVIVPKCHIASANEINAENVKYVAAIWEKIPQIASELGFAENGYRVKQLWRGRRSDCSAFTFSPYGR